MELSSPESIVEIEVEGNKKKRFKRIFVALKPCVDGFLAGYRPFIGVDAACLNGNQCCYKGSYTFTYDIHVAQRFIYIHK